MFTDRSNKRANEYNDAYNRKIKAKHSDIKTMEIKKNIQI